MRNRVLLACCALVLTAPAQAQTWRQTAVLVPPGIQPGDKFGEKLDAEGDLLVVAAHGDGALGPSTGAVYVLERDPALAQPWVLRQKLLASNAAAGAQFGYRVSVEEEGFVVYASAGWLYFFERGPGGLWAETEVLGVPSGTGHFALDGDTLALSVPFALAQQEGAVHLYARDAKTGSWSFAQLLTASDGEAFDFFGSSLALRGDDLVVGAVGDVELGQYAGSAYVFERQPSGTWTEAARLHPPDGGPGDMFGESALFHGTQCLIGTRFGTGAGPKSGSLHAFDAQAEPPWPAVDELTAFDGAAYDWFGSSVARSGSLLLVGARYAHGAAEESGSAYVLDQQGLQHKLVAGGGGFHDWFGSALALTPRYAFVGSPLDDQLGQNAGAVFVFEPGPPGLPYCTAGTSAAGCSAWLEATGLPSASAPSGFALVARDVEGGRSGLFYFGTSGRQAQPWAGGAAFQCVVPPLLRGSLLPGSGTPGTCDGTLEEDLGALWTAKPFKNPGPGAVLRAQLWYRDPLATSAVASNLSSALELVVGP
jgi:hypothetical protein